VDLTVAQGYYTIQGSVHSLAINGYATVAFPNNPVLSLSGLSFGPDPANGVLGAYGAIFLGGGELRLNYGSGPDPLPGYIAAGHITGTTYSGRSVIGYGDSDDGTIAGLPAHTAVARLTFPGDANLDLRVDFSDLLILAQHYGMTGASWDEGDFNQDGSVSFADLLLLIAEYGLGTNPP